jgi:hypothetical protein
VTEIWKEGAWSAFQPETIDNANDRTKVQPPQPASWSTYALSSRASRSRRDASVSSTAGIMKIQPYCQNSTHWRSFFRSVPSPTTNTHDVCLPGEPLTNGPCPRAHQTSLNMCTCKKRALQRRDAVYSTARTSYPCTHAQPQGRQRSGPGVSRRLR